MDNNHQQFTDKEKEQFVEWWNSGVPSKVIAKRLRRTKSSIQTTVGRLRAEGYTLIPFLDRFQAIGDYKRLQTIEERIETASPKGEDVFISVTEPEPVDAEPIAFANPLGDTEPAPMSMSADTSEAVAITTITLVNGVEISRVTAYRDRDRI